MCSSPYSDLPLLEQFLLWKMPQIHCVIWPADEEALLKCSGIKDARKKRILRAASHQSYMVVVNPATSLRRIRRTKGQG